MSPVRLSAVVVAYGVSMYFLGAMTMFGAWMTVFFMVCL